MTPAAESSARESSAPPKVDAGGIAAGEFPLAELEDIEGDRLEGFQVAIRDHVLTAIHTHGKLDTKVELCGVLVGRVFRDEFGPYLLIHASIEGAAASSHAANVTFTSETWTLIHEEMDRRFPDDRIVGWYHTHPGFGIFLSEMDVFIQANFFDLPWQVAFVYDPIGGDEGMFVWRGGAPTREPMLIQHTGELPVGTAPRYGDDNINRVFMTIILIFVAVLLIILVILEIMTSYRTIGPVGFNGVINRNG